MNDADNRPAVVGQVERPVGRLEPERATGDVVLRQLAAMHAEGVRTLRANTLAERLWPGRRQHNANGQVFPLGAAVAARLLRKCPAAREKEWRLWEILPHRLPPNVEFSGVPAGHSSNHPAGGTSAGTQG